MENTNRLSAVGKKRSVLVAVALALAWVYGVAPSHADTLTDAGFDYVQLMDTGSDCAPDNSVCITGDAWDEGGLGVGGCVTAWRYSTTPWIHPKVYNSYWSVKEDFGWMQTSHRIIAEPYTDSHLPYYVQYEAWEPYNNNSANVIVTAD